MVVTGLMPVKAVRTTFSIITISRVPIVLPKGSYRRLFTAYADDGKNQNEAGVHGTFHFKGNFMDATCPSLTDKQKEALYKVNMDNTFGLIVKNDFAPEKIYYPKKHLI